MLQVYRAVHSRPIQHKQQQSELRADHGILLQFPLMCDCFACELTGYANNLIPDLDIELLEDLLDLLSSSAKPADEPVLILF